MVEHEPLRLFDGPAGERARDVAVAQVDANAAPQFRAAAAAYIRGLPAGRIFTTDDVWAHLYLAGADQTHEPRAMGPVVLRASRDGLIEKTGTYVNTQRPGSHARPIPRWRRK